MATKHRLPFGLDGIVSNVDAFDDLADTVANPPEDRPLRGAIGRSGQLFCNLLGALPGSTFTLLGPGYYAGALMCEPYWEKEGYDPPVSEPPFSGGQCQGVAYFVSVKRFPAIQDFGQTLFGPIGAFTYQRLGPPAFRFIISVSHRDGVATSNVQDPGDAGIATYVQTVTRQGGLPDNCGDIPAPLGPGANPPPTPSFPPGQEPGVDPDGQPFFWVPDAPNPTGTGDPIPVPDPSGDGGGGDGGGPTEPPIGGDEQAGEPGDEEFPPPDEGRRWVGCCIRLTVIPLGTGTVPGTAPETILTQVVGNARLLFDSVTGDGYDTPVQVRSAGLCLWEPVKGLSPKGVRVNLKPGFEYAYTPFSVAEEK